MDHVRFSIGVPFRRPIVTTIYSNFQVTASYWPQIANFYTPWSQYRAHLHQF